MITETTKICIVAEMITDGIIQKIMEGETVNENEGIIIDGDNLAKYGNAIVYGN